MKNIKKITVVSVGNGSITAVCDMIKRGFDVVLYDTLDKAHKFESIIKNGGINYTYNGKTEFIPFDNCTTDPNKAVDGSDVIMFILPGLLVEKYAEKLAPYITEDQLVFFNTAASMSSIRFMKKAKEMGINKNYFFAEANSLTYATRWNMKEASVNLTLKVKQTLIAALPKTKTDKACKIISQMYDGIIPVEDIWRITLENANPEVHPGTCLLNTGQIEKNPDFSLYRDGYSEHSANLLKVVATERRSIANKFGYEMEDIIESRINRGYFSEDRKEIHKMFNESPVFSKINGPHSVKSRYFIEDIKDGLVLWSDLGKITGVDTPAIDAVITIGSIVCQENFREEGLTLKNLGLDGLSVEELKAMV